MLKQQILCTHCGGTGYIEKWVPTKRFDDDICEAKRELVTCNNCRGQGCEEYVMFSVNEAKAILTHCGLSTDGLI